MIELKNMKQKKLKGLKSKTGLKRPEDYQKIKKNTRRKKICISEMILQKMNEVRILEIYEDLIDEKKY